MSAQSIPLFKHTKSANNLLKMDLNEFRNVSDDNFLKYTVCEGNPNYHKEIIITTHRDIINKEGVLHKYEIFETIDKTNKVVFATKVMLFDKKEFHFTHLLLFQSIICKLIKIRGLFFGL